jgi:hypothetical protein
MQMRLNAPKKITWYVAILIGIGGIIVKLVGGPVFEPYSFWIVVIGWLILVLATYFPGF